MIAKSMKPSARHVRYVTDAREHLAGWLHRLLTSRPMDDRFLSRARRLRFLQSLLATFGLCLAVASSATPAAEASAVVETLHAALLASMQAGDVGTTARADRLRPVVDASFDFPTIARVVLGRTWGTLDEAERQRFLSVFSELSVATYAARFHSFTDERFVTLASEPGRREGEALVRTQLQRPSSGKPPVSLHYLLRARPQGDWRVVNVVADGVSDLSLKRTEYAAALQTGDIAQLIGRLEAQTRDLLDGRSKE